APFLQWKYDTLRPHELKEDERNDPKHRYASTNRRSPQPPNRRHVLDGRRIRPFLDREDLGLDPEEGRLAANRLRPRPLSEPQRHRRVRRYLERQGAVDRA